MRCSVLCVLTITAGASAQCTPEWDVTIGNPGLSGGYGQAMLVWDEGQGPRLFVGGSFTQAGGQGIGWLARWNPTNNTWSRVGGGIGQGFTNAFVTSLITYRPPSSSAMPELIVAGFFDNAGGVAQTRSLARWNGSRWDNLGANLVAPAAIWTMTTWDRGLGDQLIVGGGFTSIGGVNASGVASWNGNAWTALATSYTGFSPGVFKLMLHNDGTGRKLYAGGRFSTLDNIPAPGLLRLGASGWEPVGAGLAATSSFSQVSAMAVFDDGSGPALYIGGGGLAVNGQPVSVAKWNGSAWSPVGQSLSGNIWSLEVLNDGSGPKLYMAGTANFEVNYVARLVNGQWQPLGGGLTSASPGSNFPSAFGLLPWGDRLVVAGDFGSVGGNTAYSMAMWRACFPCRVDLNADGAVDFNDYLQFLNLFNLNEPSADFNADGAIDFNDYLEFLNLFNAGC